MLQKIDRSFIGEGVVHGRLYGGQGPFLPFGNCDAYSISYATDRKTLPNYMGGGGNRNVRERITDITASISLYDVTAENIALLTRGSVSATPLAAITAEAHSCSGVAGELVPFDFLPDLAKPISVSGSADEVLAVGSDYLLTPHGIQLLGASTAIQGVTVGYTPVPSKVVHMLNGLQVEMELYIAGLNDAQSGEPFALRCRRAKFGTLSELGVLGTDYVKLTGPMDLLADPLVTASGLSKFCEMHLVEPAA
ncbi:hypothetical protein [Pseudomonas citronellolis]|uniref:phage tail tube protein n=1 Tax=Pseudomonas citronellolis TaxID=53408 RepID=UPI0023E3CEE5|nr:hypothetical protein [Pseudomonas citronellolis]MDF3935468.1 hypothetical protein [Pseudomonas citronellolis]